MIVGSGGCLVCCVGAVLDDGHGVDTIDVDVDDVDDDDVDDDDDLVDDDDLEDSGVIIGVPTSPSLVWPRLF